MSAGLRDKKQFLRFFGVSSIGMVADYVLAVALAEVLYVEPGIATSCGFLLGTVINYFGHSLFSFRTAQEEKFSLKGYGKYLIAVLMSLVVRVVIVELLGYFTALPFWLILLCAIGFSFVTSYVISALWVFRRSD